MREKYLYLRKELRNNKTMKPPKFENKIRVNVCMTPIQRDKLRALGGSKFVQWVIDNTPLPKLKRKP